MHRNDRSSLWLVLALIAPLAHYAGAGYLTVALAVGAFLPLTMLTGDGLCSLTRVEAFLEWIWTGIVLGAILPESGCYWPGSKSRIVVPLALLLLALAAGDRERSKRTGCTLFWMALVPALVAAASLIGTIELQWLRPQRELWRGELILILLVPALGSRFSEKEKPGIRTPLIIGGIGILLAAIVQGGLSLGTAAEIEAPVYELGRCVGNGGFEILISVVMTMSWYALVLFLMQSGIEFAERCNMSREIGKWIIFLAATVMILFDIKLKGMVLARGALILWILIPMLHKK